MLIAAYAIKKYGIFTSYPQGSFAPCKADMGKSMIIRQRLNALALSSPIFYIFMVKGERFSVLHITPFRNAGRR